MKRATRKQTKKRVVVAGDAADVALDDGGIEVVGDTQKQKRSAAFTQAETDLLLQLHVKYNLAVAGTNELTQQGRTKAWNKLWSEYCSSPYVTVRIFFL